MKLFISRFFHETATFSKNITALKQFKECEYTYGQEFYQSRINTKGVVGGIIDVANENHVDLFFSLNAGAVPSGIVTQDVYDKYLTTVISDLQEQSNIDGIILDLHGAMVVENIDDPESTLLTQIRAITNSQIPIIIVLDYHANVGQTTIDKTDITIVYKTYPHVDMYQCGLEATNLMLKLLKNEIKPTAAFINLPIISPLLSQGTFCEPMKSLMSSAQNYYTNKDVLNISLAPGFPYADISENGFSIIVTTNNNPSLAKAILTELSQLVWSKRSLLTSYPLPVKEAVALAKNAIYHNKPIILCDAADNPGGGSSGDGVEILRELINQGVDDALVSTIWDPISAIQMHKHKVGEKINLLLGGKSSEHLNTSLNVEARIISLKNGTFINKGPFNNGKKIDIGLTGLIDIDGIKVIVHEKRAQTLDREIIRFTGINPEDQKIIVVKSTIHYRADFEPISAKIIEVDAPGIVTPNLADLQYKKIRVPSYPFQPIERPF